MLSPELFHDLVDGHRPPVLIDAQGHQLLGLAGAEFHRLPVHQHIKIPEGVKENPLALAAAQQLGPLHHVGDVLPIKGLEDDVVRLHLQGLHREPGVGGGKDDDDVAPQPPQGLGQLDAVHPRHVDIQQGKVHHMAGGVLDGCVGVGEFPHDFKIGEIRALELKELQIQQHVVHQDGFQSRSPLFSSILILYQMKRTKTVLFHGDRERFSAACACFP